MQDLPTILEPVLFENVLLLPSGHCQGRKGREVPPIHWYFPDPFPAGKECFI